MMRSAWQQLLVVALVLVSASWNESHGQPSRWQPVARNPADGSTIWIDGQSLREMGGETLEGWFELRYGVATRDSSMFELNGRWRREDGLGYRHFSVGRAKRLMRADCMRRRFMLVDWVLYDPEGTIVDHKPSDAETKENSVVPESAAELMFNALCRRQSRER